jgi:hypothetical protein
MAMTDPLQALVSLQAAIRKGMATQAAEKYRSVRAWWGYPTWHRSGWQQSSCQTPGFRLQIASLVNLPWRLGWRFKVILSSSNDDY